MKLLEKVNVPGLECSLCELKGKCTDADCKKDYYWISPKLLGTIEEFLSTISNVTRRTLAEEVWKWSEERLKEETLQTLLKWSMEEMNRTLGTDEWQETKETLMYTGPDNYSLEKPRNQQESIKRAWWSLVKYQYSKRYGDRV